MFTKPLAELTYDDIVELVEVRQEREGRRLDYKGAIGDPEKAKKELAKDVCAFANSDGGVLVIGVDKDRQIVGVEPKVNNRDVDEWLNQVLVGRIEPAVKYADPKLIEVPESNKVVVILQVPESADKPHRMVEGSAYMVRMNDSSKPAEHSQVRSMFHGAERRDGGLDAFLDQRNLLHEDAPLFGQNRNSSRLVADGFVPGDAKQPLVIFSLQPRMPFNHKRPYPEMKEWLDQHSRGFEPAPSRSLFYMVETEPLLAGFFMKTSNGDKLNSYFELLDSGYIEAGLSKGVAKWWKDERSGNVLRPSIFLTSIVGYEMMLLAFAREHYRYSAFENDVRLQVTFVNMGGAVLAGFNSKYQLRGATPPNTHHPNFKITAEFAPVRLSDDDIRNLAQVHSTQVCRAFGLEYDLAFHDGRLDQGELSHAMI